MPNLPKGLFLPVLGNFLVPLMFKLEASDHFGFTHTKAMRCLFLFERDGHIKKGHVKRKYLA